MSYLQRSGAQSTFVLSNARSPTASILRSTPSRWFLAMVSPFKVDRAPYVPLNAVTPTYAASATILACLLTIACTTPVGSAASRVRSALRPLAIGLAHPFRLPVLSLAPESLTRALLRFPSNHVVIFDTPRRPQRLLGRLEAKAEVRP